MALILHIETATKVCSVALSENGNLLSCVESNDENFSHGEKLNMFIDKVFNDAAKEIQKLEAVSISSGPGSYTGLRIGVSTAKGICYGLQIPLIAIDSLKCLANLAQEKFPSAQILAMIDARRMEVYAAIYKADSVLKPISADVLEETSYPEFDNLVLVGDAVEKTKALFQQRNFKFESSLLSSATGQVKQAFEKFKRKEFEDLAYFEPFYLKDFIAGKAKEIKK